MDPNFIIVPSKDPKSYLWEAFPELRSELDDPDEGPYYVYDRYADYLLSHRDDDLLWRRSYTFFESLAVGGEEDLLVVALFEPLFVDPVVKDRLKGNLGPSALKLFENMLSFWEQR
jgi:hypothetical protein